MESILGIALIPFVPALLLTLLLRNTVRHGVAWAIGVGLVLAVGLFVYLHYFTDHYCDSGGSGCGDIGDLSFLDFVVPFVGFMLWLLGVGAGAVLSRLARRDHGDRPPEF